MQRQHRMVVPLLVVWLLLADRRAFSHAASPEVELQLGWQRSNPLDLKSGALDDPAPEREGVEVLNSAGTEDSDLLVPAWNEQVLELDELTRCIRGSEAGNAIERWLDCLASLEEVRALPGDASIPPKPSQSFGIEQSPITTDLGRSDAEVNRELFLGDDSMDPFEQLSIRSTPSTNLGRFDENSDRVEGLGSAVDDSSAGTTQERSSDESPNFKAAVVSEEEGSGAESAASLGFGDGVRPGASASPGMTVAEISLEDNRLPGDAQSAPHGRRSSSKWGTDISSVSGDVKTSQSSGCDEDGEGLEVSAEAPDSTQRSQNLLDALKLAACLGAAVTLLWRRRGRLRPLETAKQSVLSEGSMDYPCPSATGFSMTARSSSNTDVCYPIVKAGSLSAPLGMAIATVMAEQTLQQGYGERAPRTADDLSKLLEAAMTESLTPVMGSECPGFVEQFKQSFRSTYRVLGSVRNLSGRKPAAPPFSNRSRGFSQRRPGGPSRYNRRTDDEEDDNSGLAGSSRVAYFDPMFESDSPLHGRVDPESESELAEQLSRLTFSAKRLGTAAHSRLEGTSPLRHAAGGAGAGESPSHADQEAFGEFDDVSSPLGRHPSEGLPEKSSGNGVPRDNQIGLRRRWGRGGLEQLANLGGAEGVGSPSTSEQVARMQESNSLDCGDPDLALQPFGFAPPGLLVAASESSVSHHGGETHYKQQKIELMEQEMHLRKMELAYKFRDLNLKEASLHLSSESNSLMRENVDLSRNRAEFKEAEFQDRKLTLAYAVLAKRCADEMVAGLCVMLCALFFGAWNYSHERLVDVVSICQPTLYEPSNSYVPGLNTVVNSLNHFISLLHMFACEVTVASRMFLGLGIISVVAASLLRKSVTSNSQAMPATILIVVLGVICGVAGKFAVDSMGGSGYHWLLLWETFCLVHSSATCFTSALYRILNGVPSSSTGKGHQQLYFIRPWWRRFWFHFTTVLVLPILAGLLPFAPVREIVEVLGSHLWNWAFSPVMSYLRENYRFSLV